MDLATSWKEKRISNSLWRGNTFSNNLEGRNMYFATAFERKEEVKIGHNKKQEADSPS